MESCILLAACFIARIGATPCEHSRPTKPPPGSSGKRAVCESKKQALPCLCREIDSAVTGFPYHENPRDSCTGQAHVKIEEMCSDDMILAKSACAGRM
jgi:hypothetical protein